MNSEEKIREKKGGKREESLTHDSALVAIHGSGSEHILLNESSTLPPLSSSPASPTLRDTLQISRCGGVAAAAAREKMDGNGSSLGCFARNPSPPP